MRNTLILIMILLSYCSCGTNTSQDSSKTNQDNETQRIPFEIFDGRFIMCKMQLNDSIPINVVFDIGVNNCGIDSSFWYKHYMPKGKKASVLSPFTLSLVNVEIHNKMITLGNQNTKIKFNDFSTYNFHKGFGYLDSNIHAFISIPHQDTNHIWELNFEKNYIEIHEHIDLSTYKNQINIPLRRLNENNRQEFWINMPLKIMFPKDTLTSNTEYLMDTGSPYDIFYHRYSQREVEFLQQYGENIPVPHSGSSLGYIQKNVVKSLIFNHFYIDSLRIYNSMLNLMTTKGGKDSLKTVGLNFLKHFNIFMDLKNNAITFVPIQNYTSLPCLTQEPEARCNVIFAVDYSLPVPYLHFYRFIQSQNKTPNIFQSMGAKYMDILISLNEIKIDANTENYNAVISDIVEKSNSLELVIKRNGKLITLHHDKNK